MILEFAPHSSSPSMRLGWAQRLRRVFGIDVEHCGGPLRVIASIEDAPVIGKILGYLGERGEYVAGLKARAPPPGLSAATEAKC